MPELFKYFTALDLTTDLFLFEWLLTLFAQNMDIEIVARIWDNFLIDGEVFAIRMALAILKYFEYQL